MAAKEEDGRFVGYDHRLRASRPLASRNARTNGEGHFSLTNDDLPGEARKGFLTRTRIALSGSKKESVVKQTTKNNHFLAGARRIAEKQRKAAAQQVLSKLDAEYVAKARHDCLRAANARMGGADPHAVVREAEKDFRARVAFLTGVQS
jgi:hypothetical protein